MIGQWGEFGGWGGSSKTMHAACHDSEYTLCYSTQRGTRSDAAAEDCAQRACQGVQPGTYSSVSECERAVQQTYGSRFGSATLNAMKATCPQYVVTKAPYDPVKEPYSPTQAVAAPTTSPVKAPYTPDPYNPTSQTWTRPEDQLKADPTFTTRPDSQLKADPNFTRTPAAPTPYIPGQPVYPTPVVDPWNCPPYASCCLVDPQTGRCATSSGVPVPHPQSGIPAPQFIWGPVAEVATSTSTPAGGEAAPAKRRRKQPAPPPTTSWTPLLAVAALGLLVGGGTMVALRSR